MKPIFIVGIGIAILAIIFFWMQSPQQSGAALLGDEVLVTVFEKAGQQTGSVLVQVPFVRSLENAATISISIDADRNGQFEGAELLVDSFPLVATREWRSGYYALTQEALEHGMEAQVVIDAETYTVPIALQKEAAGALFDLETVTDPENATKGLGVPVAFAQETVQITQANVPDLNQRIGECAPTAAANSLISLVNKNGGEDLISGDPQDFIENLKRHMNWTAENGVPPDDFVDGKNRWAAAAGVPIRTTKVGDDQGLSTIDAIRDALQKGDAVELRIRFADAGGTTIVSGHMVTVVGIHQGQGQTYLEINDPYTHDTGTEMVEIRANKIVNYGPYIDGPVLLSWGFVQTWEGHPTSELLDTMTDEEIQGIRQFAGDTPMLTVIEYEGKYLPTSQLVVENEAGCGANHYHAEDGSVTATDGTEVPDPGPQCGYGKVSERPSMNIPAPERNE